MANHLVNDVFAKIAEFVFEHGSGNRVFTISPQKIKLLLKTGGYLLFILCLYFIFMKVKSEWDNFPALDWSFRNSVLLSIALVIAFLNSFLGWLAWMLLANIKFKKPEILKSLAVFMVPQIYKYIPSNIFHHLGKIGMAKKYDLGAHAIAVSIVLEILFVIIAAAIPGFIAISYSGFTIINFMPTSGAFLFLTAALIITLSILYISIKQKKIHVIHNYLASRNIQLPSPGKTAAVMSIYMSSFLLLGISTCFILLIFTDITILHFLFLTGAVAASWLAGFVIPGAPGGMGVREAVFIAITANVINPPQAIILSLLIRAISIITDILVFFVGWLVKNKIDNTANEIIEKY